ncbi:hypothetical protein J7M28_14120 [bacterium]|nr:hypothetical protein [bacterium]
MKSIFICGLVVAFFTFPLLCSGISFENHTNANIVIRALLVDGPFLWAGTDGGLIRWCMINGSSEKFTTSDGLVHNQVSSIAHDAEGGVWVGALGGASRYYMGMWTRLDVSTGLVSPRVEAIHVAGSGDVWIGTTGGLSVLKSDGIKNYTEADGLPCNWVTDIAEFDDRMFFATDEGVGWFDGETFGNYDTSDNLPSNNITCLVVTPEGLWAGTRGTGVCLFDGSSWRTFTSADGIEGSVIADLSVSADFSVWAVTERGVSLHSGGVWLSFNKSHGLPDASLLSISTDPEGNVYLGTGDEGIWCWYNGNALVLKSLEGLLDNRVHCVAKASDGSTWFGCNSGVSVLTDGEWRSFRDADSIKLGAVNDIIQSQDGAMWIATDEAGLARFDGETWTLFDASSGLLSDEALSVASRGESVYCGTSLGLSILDIDGISSITQDDGLPFESVDVVDVDQNGRIIVGSSSERGGLVVIDGADMTHYTVTDGLPSDCIYAINAEKQGVVWLGTDFGASRWDDNGFRMYLVEEGLISYTVKSISYGPYGDVWLGQMGGISRFDGASFENFSAIHGLADNRVGDLCAGSDDDLWVATLGGAARVSFAAGPEPELVLKATSPVCRPGQQVGCSLSLSNSGASRSFDLYVGLITEDDRVFCLMSWGSWQEGAIAPWAQGIMVPPEATVSIDPLITMLLPSYFPPVIEPGRYAFAAAVANAMTPQFLGDVAIAPFEFYY